MELPALPWTGGCQCGALRFTITGPPLTLYACHCTECRRQSASLHGLSLWVREAHFRLTGVPAKWTRDTDSGRRTDCFFCPDCGSRLWHKGSGEPDHPLSAILSVKAGLLDIAHLLGPVGHIWTRSAMAGAAIPDNLLTCDRQPESFDALIEAFNERYRIAEA